MPKLAHPALSARPLFVDLVIEIELEVILRVFIVCLTTRCRESHQHQHDSSRNTADAELQSLGETRDKKSDGTSNQLRFFARRGAGEEGIPGGGAFGLPRFQLAQ